MAATDTESMQDNMTRLRMKMVQQKLANERERLQRPGSVSSNNDEEHHIKLQQAMIRRQELLDRIRQEQFDDQRPRTYSPRRRYTPSPLPPPSRRSLPDLSRAYHFNWYNKEQQPHRERQEAGTLARPKTNYVYWQGRPRSYPLAKSMQYELPPLQYQSQPLTTAEMAQTKHVIEHQFRHAEPPSPKYMLPPIQQSYQQQPIIHAAPQQITIPAPQQQIIQAQPQPTIIQASAPPPVIQQMPSVTVLDGNVKGKDTMFNKSDFMDMMMLQNAQMHHMVMQQMMLQNLPGNQSCGGGSCKLPTAQVPLAPVMGEMRAPMSYSAPAPVVHHYQSAPPMMGMQGPPPGRVMRRMPQKPSIAPIGRIWETGPGFHHPMHPHQAPKQTKHESVYLYGRPSSKEREDSAKRRQQAADRQLDDRNRFFTEKAREPGDRKIRSSGPVGPHQGRAQVQGPTLKNYEEIIPLAPPRIDTPPTPPQPRKGILRLGASSNQNPKLQKDNISTFSVSPRLSREGRIGGGGGGEGPRRKGFWVRRRSPPGLRARSAERRRPAYREPRYDDDPRRRPRGVGAGDGDPRNYRDNGYDLRRENVPRRPGYVQTPYPRDPPPRGGRYRDPYDSPRRPDPRGGRDPYSDRRGYSPPDRYERGGGERRQLGRRNSYSPPDRYRGRAREPRRGGGYDGGGGGGGDRVGFAPRRAFRRLNPDYNRNRGHFIE